MFLSSSHGSSLLSLSRVAGEASPLDSCCVLAIMYLQVQSRSALSNVLLSQEKTHRPKTAKPNFLPLFFGLGAAWLSPGPGLSSCSLETLCAHSPPVGNHAAAVGGPGRQVGIISLCLLKTEKSILTALLIILPRLPPPLCHTSLSLWLNMPFEPTSRNWFSGFVTMTFQITQRELLQQEPRGLCLSTWQQALRGSN